jgi:nickel transport protein
MIRTLSMAFALSLSICSLACAHDLWVQQSGNELQVVSGHEGVTTPCDPSKIREVKAFDLTGKLKKAETHFQGKAAVLTVPGSVAAVTAYQEEGFRSVTPDGEKPLSKRAAKDSVDTRFYQNYTKTIFNWNNSLTRPLGSAFEIVPLKNPLTLKPGKKFPIVVYFNGKPLAGVWVDDGTNDGIREKTDGKGRLTVTVGKKGRQFITVFRETDYKDLSEADKLSLTANLTYLVK